MTDSEIRGDKRIAALLQEDAPPARDPVFRIGVMERRERDRFRRRSLILLAASLLIALVGAIAVAMGGRTAQTAMVLLVSAGLAAVYYFYAPLLQRLLQRFRI